MCMYFLQIFESRQLVENVSDGDHRKQYNTS